MPKIGPGGPTSAGFEGHVVDALDRVHEVDPSRNVDGTVVEGYDSDERKLSDRDAGESPRPGDEPAPAAPEPGQDAGSEDESADETDKEDKPSGGSSSSRPVSKTPSSRVRK